MPRRLLNGEESTAWTRTREPAAPGTRKVSHGEGFMFSYRHRPQHSSSLGGEHHPSVMGPLTCSRHGELTAPVFSFLQWCFLLLPTTQPFQATGSRHGTELGVLSQQQELDLPTVLCIARRKHTMRRTETLVSRARHRRTLLQQPEEGRSTSCLSYAAVLWATKESFALFGLSLLEHMNWESVWSCKSDGKAHAEGSSSRGTPSPGHSAPLAHHRLLASQGGWSCTASSRDICSSDRSM